MSVFYYARTWTRRRQDAEITLRAAGQHLQGAAEITHQRFLSGRYCCKIRGGRERKWQFFCLSFKKTSITRSVAQVGPADHTPAQQCTERFLTFQIFPLFLWNPSQFGSPSATSALHEFWPRAKLDKAPPALWTKPVQFLLPARKSSRCEDSSSPGKKPATGFLAHFVEPGACQWPLLHLASGTQTQSPLPEELKKSQYIFF